MRILNRFTTNRSPRGAPPALPEGVRVYAVGDIHGRYDLLLEIYERIQADLSGNKPVHSVGIFLGDYVDRGPSSRDVLAWISECKLVFNEWVFLRGNHEEALERFLAEPGIVDQWRQFGGFETLYSYGVTPPVDRSGEAIDSSHQEFVKVFPDRQRRLLAQMENHVIVGDYFFVHAGVRPGVALDQQETDDLLWIREPFLSSGADFGKFVVHGHTPVAEPDERVNRFNIDTGAYLTNRLTCLVLEGQGRRIFQTGGAES